MGPVLGLPRVDRPDGWWAFQVLEEGASVMTKPTYKPGQSAPTSGQYSVHGPRGGDLGREITISRGETLPPTSQPGQTYRLADPTKHKR